MCDTAVVVGSGTVDGSVIFAKNSDRPANECQPLNYFPRREYPSGTRVRCTWIDVPQVRDTFAILASRPCWMWGAEIGVNEHGVAIGNEAVYTREPYQETGLLGMDLIRLGLERGRDAYQAMHVIVDLLEEFGQGGSCDAVNPRTYHNSFIIADHSDAWVLETAGRRWVAEKVRTRRSISNVLTIASNWDEASPDLIDHAVDEGWCQKHEDFNFAKAYGDPGRNVQSGACRYARSTDLIAERTGLSTLDLAEVLRDHAGVLEDGSPSPICMHATPPRAGETAASFVAHLLPDVPAILRTLAWTSFGSPCLSPLLPVHVGAVVPPTILGAGGSRFDSASPWWRSERIQRRVDLFPSLRAPVQQICRALEGNYRNAVALAEDQARALPVAEARHVLQCLVDLNTERLLDTLGALEDVTSGIGDLPRPPADHIAHWERINQSVGLNL